MRAESPIMEADTAQGTAIRRARGPWDRTAAAVRETAEPTQVHERRDHRADVMPAFAALVPASLSGAVAFTGSLLSGQGMGYSLLAYTLVGSAIYGLVITLALLRGQVASGRIRFETEPKTIPTERRKLTPSVHAPASRDRPCPPQWNRQCVARPVGSIHDRR